ncbi:hypothetical protein OPQ81_010601 [Rhizoctonia solani]|nr:hypothetical protein OPQ81_010601 [Rhizoctonia solani]
MTTFDDAQQIIRTILSVTKLHLPSELLLGRQCTLDTNIPIKTGITCDVYLASFLGGEKVAKKVFRIGMSDKQYVEKYAKRYMVSPLMKNFDAICLQPLSSTLFLISPYYR